MSAKPADRSETPDDLSPEWTEYETRWSVNVADFDGPMGATRFLARRNEIFRAAAAAGVPKDLLTPFEPNKPGFEERLRSAVSGINRSLGWAAE
jgi:hypothetical protein